MPDNDMHEAYSVFQKIRTRQGKLLGGADTEFSVFRAGWQASARRYHELLQRCLINGKLPDNFKREVVEALRHLNRIVVSDA